MRKSNPDFHHIRSYILMCVVSLTFSTIYAQTPEPKLTLKLQNTSLSEVIRQIEQDTGFSFIYGEEVKLDHKVSLNVQKKPLREVLNLLFANKPISSMAAAKPSSSTVRFSSCASSTVSSRGNPKVSYK